MPWKTLQNLYLGIAEVIPQSVVCEIQQSIEKVGTPLRLRYLSLGHVAPNDSSPLLQLIHCCPNIQSLSFTTVCSLPIESLFSILSGLSQLLELYLSPPASDYLQGYHNINAVWGAIPKLERLGIVLQNSFITDSLIQSITLNLPRLKVRQSSLTFFFFSLLF